MHECFCLWEWWYRMFAKRWGRFLSGLLYFVAVWSILRNLAIYFGNFDYWAHIKAYLLKTRILLRIMFFYFHSAGIFSCGWGLLEKVHMILLHLLTYHTHCMPSTVSPLQMKWMRYWTFRWRYTIRIFPSYCSSLASQIYDQDFLYRPYDKKIVHMIQVDQEVVNAHTALLKLITEVKTFPIILLTFLSN